MLGGQTDATTNGLHNASTGNWTRMIDANNNSQWASGKLVIILSGAQFAESLCKTVERVAAQTRASYLVR